jgi:hypothetical protein
MFGHADTGRVLLVLASDAEVVDELDLTPVLAGSAGRPLLTRYACNQGDRYPPSGETPIEERFAGRAEVELLRLQDLDGDGVALEISLLSDVSDCEAERVVLGVDPQAPEILVIDGGR